MNQPADLGQQAMESAAMVLPLEDDEPSYVAANPIATGHRDMSQSLSRSQTWNGPVVFGLLEENNLPQLTLQGQRPRQFEYFLRTFSVCGGEDEAAQMKWLIPGESLVCSLRHVDYDRLHRSVQVWSLVERVKLFLQGAGTKLPETAQTCRA